MRSTIFFISMLLFVSCSQDLATKSNEEIDTGLLELAKDPASDAVFATMAIQLEAKGGFQKVLGLLNSLVHDSKEQLHAMTKTWRGVNARCQVSRVKLAGRQEFFTTYLSQANRRHANAQARLAEVRDHISAYKKSQGVYSSLLKQEITRHQATANHVRTRITHAAMGLDGLKNAHAAVKSWSPKSKALVQTHMTRIAASYLQVKEMELPSVTELLERTNDTKVKKRLLEWMGQVKNQMSVAAANFRTQLKDIARFGGALEKALAHMVTSLRRGLASLSKAVVLAQHTISASKAAITLYGKLAKENTGLIAANKAYCANESVNFHRNEVAAKAAIKLFREVRTYFTQNYKKVHGYIKSKYHESAGGLDQ
jgi:biopolymer transport protein ExbB/TolQ